MEHYILTLTILKAITVLLGGIFLYFVGRAYLKHRSRPMMWLFIAVALMMAAAVAEGTAFRILDLSLEASHVVEAVFTLLAFLVLVYSVMSHRFP